MKCRLIFYIILLIASFISNIFAENNKKDFTTEMYPIWPILNGRIWFPGIVSVSGGGIYNFSSFENRYRIIGPMILGEIGITGVKANIGIGAGGIHKVGPLMARVSASYQYNWLGIKSIKKLSQYLGGEITFHFYSQEIFFGIAQNISKNINSKETLFSAGIGIGL